MQISEGVIRLGLITVRDLHNFSNSDHTRAHSITKSRSFKSPEQGLRRNPPQGRIQDFFRRGWLVSCSTSTPINHIVLFFLQNTSCIRKPQVISRGGGVRTPCTLPLDPPLLLWKTDDLKALRCRFISPVVYFTVKLYHLIWKRSSLYK